MTGLVKLPFRLARTGVSLGLEVARFVDRQVRGGSGDAARPASPQQREQQRSQPGTANGRATSARTSPPPQQAAAAPSPPTRAQQAPEDFVVPPSAQPAPPSDAPQPEFQERHIDAEAEEVASFGPEEDAGAQVTIGAPWPEYDGMGAQDVVARVRDADDTTKAMVLLYERQGKNRRTVVAAAGG